MDRRDFLKTLGLAGVALTLPKPLDIIAAKMADIAKPPLHVGHCKMGPLSDEEQGRFVMQGISLTPQGDRKSLEWHNDFYDKWKFTMSFRRGGESAPLDSWLQVPVNYIPLYRTPTGYENFLFVDGGSSKHFASMNTQSPMAFMWAPGDVAEFWITPSLRDNLPKFPLMDCVVMVHGWMFNRKKGSVARDYSTTYWSRFKTVQIDRARAIEMGLVSPEEPEGIIA